MFLKTLSVLPFFATFALSQVVVPPPGLFCCPVKGPHRLPLEAQQVGPFNIFCQYGTNLQCIYNPATGAGATIAGCPSQAPANPHPPTCPI
ncbi:hypothetical protein GALMADRAFT_232639 [Galerina marginata CBS 339.88]|uniref:CBM1 domain-containing protein n=1 Tax=Galerina marginata (strain CBS 339.88) TaxID=685588 RepID=A0A067S647_GALM3|nr:hypothetical protein GALMADRAFT_232639 [Galerina marginata CBS 339.88]